MSTTVKEKSISRLVWCAKSISILCVIIAHSSFLSIEQGWLSMLLKRIGSMGVPVFLMLSAYYFYPKKYGSICELLKSRKGIFIPWIILGSVCYLWSNLRTGKAIGIRTFLQFLLGYNSFLYFLSVLIVLQLIFYYLRFKSITVLTIGSIAISVLSTELAAFGITNSAIARIGLTNYLNIFNWMGFYSVGLFLQTKTADEITGFLKKYFALAIGIWSVLFFFGYYCGPGEYGYFSVLGPFMECASAIILLRIAWLFCGQNWIVHLGKYSFAMYLLHLNVVPVVYKFLGGNVIGELVSPVCTYLITFVLIKCSCMVLAKMKMGYLAKYLLGVRVE